MVSKIERLEYSYIVENFYSMITHIRNDLM